ncbi:hypothetical protein GCM10010331_54250 [Streptomyces xanthochromogenes]|nr:hypothetical protein GCM10010331_54250 [Streptomyces xanthochromogenes]
MPTQEFPIFGMGTVCAARTALGGPGVGVERGAETCRRPIEAEAPRLRFMTTNFATVTTMIHHNLAIGPGRDLGIAPPHAHVPRIRRELGHPVRQVPVARVVTAARGPIRRATPGRSPVSPPLGNQRPRGKENKVTPRHLLLICRSDLASGHDGPARRRVLLGGRVSSRDA